MRSTELVQWFRQSSPYVNAHRGKTFVLMLDGATLASHYFVNIIDDISLLHSLGIRLVVVFGARDQINLALAEKGIAEHYHKHIRISDPATLDTVKQVVGALQYDITARLSLRMNKLQGNAVPNVISGNFVIAQPMGVDDGVDYQLSGKVRRIDIHGIKNQLAQNAIVVISPVAVSVTGETFNLAFEELASKIAVKLEAEKLIGFCDQQGILDAQQQVISDLNPDQAQQVLDTLINLDRYHCSQARFLQAAIEACCNGVKRAHLLSNIEDGALLQELFSRDGIGTQISLQNSEIVRTATIQDIPNLLGLIQPLEQQGILVKRSREQLEMEIERYTIIDRDGVIIACAALNLYPTEKMAEMACVAVHPDYRNSSRGDVLLNTIQKRAKQLQVERLFVLTTRTVHWFQERGFQLASVEDLPAEKRQHYNHQRRSKILIQDLTTNSY
ncbi:amino-acid N-acetyltransferase [Mergibacter septicus]|uniref:amino-acid N-acetyltransferase n=1 Tax=Mergibacter septicus TaxID=221402 RepID=UPI001C76E36E|nr:amino-acid N-acetyltransferase [Mergibacter septicus]QDJ13618.1 amino-acid N-acetyltransferase [Mergibacter septicus]